MTTRKLPLDPKLPPGVHNRLRELFTDTAIITRSLQDRLDGVTASTAELNLLDGVTATTAELNILDGVTSTAAELNILDGVTATAAELNILDGVTATATEINLLDGITALAFGTYSPTITNVANASSLAASAAQYLRIGNIVTVSGKITCTTDDATITTVTLTLPVSSTFTADAEAAGVLHVYQTGGTPVNSAGKVFSANGGTVARLEWRGIAASGSMTGYYTYTYQVL